jgi:D-serine deaminase-like pyridoxal phosphate-dependent protein
LAIEVEKGRAIVDAGWRAMSRDQGTAWQKRDYGYGAVCSLEGELLDGYVITDANQEHGIVSRTGERGDSGTVARFRAGTRLRILPNHACATGAKHSLYHVLAQDGSVHTWTRFNG